MLLVARKNLFSERTRLAISVGGVALSVFLISLLVSLYRGWDEKVGQFVDNSNVDVWIGFVGANDFITANSILSLDGTQAISGMPEIQQWSPIIVRPMTGVKIQLPQHVATTKMNLLLVGYDTTTGISGPIKIMEGKGAPGDGEVVIDKALASRYGVGVNDIVSAGGREWTVIGISEGGDFVASQTVFVSLAQAQSVLGMQNQATFIGYSSATERGRRPR